MNIHISKVETKLYLYIPSTSLSVSFPAIKTYSALGAELRSTVSSVRIPAHLQQFPHNFSCASRSSLSAAGATFFTPTKYPLFPRNSAPTLTTTKSCPASSIVRNIVVMYLKTGIRNSTTLDNHRADFFCPACALELGRPPGSIARAVTPDSRSSYRKRTLINAHFDRTTKVHTSCNLRLRSIANMTFANFAVPYL